jgi:hypothetical protein
MNNFSFSFFLVKMKNYINKFLANDNRINNNIQQQKQEKHNDDNVDNVFIDVNDSIVGRPSNPSIISLFENIFYNIFVELKNEKCII